MRQLTQMLLENAGATRGVLLLSDRGQFAIPAALRVQAERVVVDRSEPELSHTFTSPAVRYCACTLESVEPENAARGEFTAY